VLDWVPLYPFFIDLVALAVTAVHIPCRTSQIFCRVVFAVIKTDIDFVDMICSLRVSPLEHGERRNGEHSSLNGFFWREHLLLVHSSRSSVSG
jgi:hypothetical protein